MQKAIKILILIFVFTGYNATLFSQALDISGTWILNFEKSRLDKNDNLNGLTGQVFIIKQEGNKFSLKIYHIYGDKKKKIGFSMIADGKTRTIKLIFKGKLEQMDNSLQATLWRKNYLNIVRYTFGTTQNELVADEVFTGRPKDHHSVWVFDKEVLLNPIVHGMF